MSEQQGFESNGNGNAVAEREVGAVAASTRERAKIESALTIAQHHKRDELAAYNGLLGSCKRPRFAEAAAYSFRRGRAQVSGPSAQLAREASRLWGNIQSGIDVVSIDDEHVHISGWAVDLQTNTWRASDAKFGRKIQRKNKKTGTTIWVDPDERDLRELVNKHGAIAERNALLKLLPPDMIDEAIETAQATLRKAASGALEKDRAKELRRLLQAFESLHVSKSMIEEHLGHPVEDMDGEEYADLAAIGRSIKDGHTKRADHFTVGAAAKPEGQTAADILGDDTVEEGDEQGEGQAQDQYEDDPFDHMAEEQA